ncbi:MAG: hypothetical protein N2C14_02295, partial [Planctomycetales bacterium]
FFTDETAAVKVGSYIRVQGKGGPISEGLRLNYSWCHLMAEPSDTPLSAPRPVDSALGDIRPPSFAPPPTVAPTTTRRSDPIGLVNEPPPSRDDDADFTMQAVEFHAERQESIRENRQAAFNSKYNGRIVDIDGVAVGYHVAGDLGRGNKSKILLQGVKGTDFLGCPMVTENPWREVSVGQSVTIRMRFDGAASDLTQGIVLEQGFNPIAAETVSAATLSVQYRADRSAVEGQFNNRYVVVTGEIIKNEAGPSNSRVVCLYDVQPRVVCQFEASDHPEMSLLEVGKFARVVGYYATNSKPDEVVLRLCHLMSEPSDSPEDDSSYDSDQPRQKTPAEIASLAFAAGLVAEGFQYLTASMILD